MKLGTRLPGNVHFALWCTVRPGLGQHMAACPEEILDHMIDINLYELRTRLIGDFIRSGRTTLSAFNYTFACESEEGVELQRAREWYS